MSDLIVVSLPREEVQRIMERHNSLARENRRTAKGMEKFSPKTKRNARAIAQYLAAVQISEDIASLCSHALSNADDMTHMASDAEMHDGQFGIDHKFYDDPSLPS